MIKGLSGYYVSRYGAPILHSVDTDVFLKTYFTFCRECSFCHDACCSHGVDIDARNVLRIETYAGQLAEYTGVGRERWFAEEYEKDTEFPGGSYTRTQVVNGACVFHHPAGKGCQLHSFCVERGIDYHELKPMVSCLFPLTFDEGLLHPSEEAREDELVCLGKGPSLYRGVREEVRYYFGSKLVDELDGLERACVQQQMVSPYHLNSSQ